VASWSSVSEWRHALSCVDGALRRMSGIETNSLQRALNAVQGDIRASSKPWLGGFDLGPAWLVAESPNSGLESLDRIGQMYMVTYI
jgi:hypothetical protein